MFRKLRVILFFTILTPGVGHALSARTFNTDNDAIYEKFCRGDFQGFENDLRHIHPYGKNYISSRSLYLLSSEGQAEAAKAAEKIPDDITTLSETDRYVLALYLLVPSPTDFTKVRELINFKGSNVIIESYRGVLEAFMDRMDSDPTKALWNLIQSFNDLPYLDKFILEDIFTLGSIDKHANLVIGEYYPLIDQLSDSDPVKYRLLAAKAGAMSGYKDKDTIFENDKKAFDLCRYNQRYALTYASELIYDKKYDEALAILQEIVSLNPNYYTVANLHFAEIYLAQHGSKKANEYLAKADAKRMYLSKRDIASLDKMMGKRDYGYFIIVGAMLLLGVLIYLRRVSSKRRSGREE